NDYGIWSDSSGTLTLIAREGAQAPGTPDGVNFPGNFQDFGNPGLNDSGQTAFSAGLTGAGVDASNDNGIWATDRTGVLQLIVREGDVLEVAPGQFRTVATAFFRPHDLFGTSEGFNNLGQVAFVANFTDGSSGIFVSDAVAVPEPQSIAIAAIGAACLIIGA